MKKIIACTVIMCSVGVIAACGKKDDAAAVQAAASGNDGWHEPHIRQTQKFGYVSSIVLEPVYSVPGEYSSYVRQEITEATRDEYQKAPDAMFSSYVENWKKQAASVESPDWTVLASIQHPETVEETNEFKKQEWSDKVKSEIPTDKNSLNMILGWQGEILNVNGPDVTTGEYYLTIRPHSRYSTVSWNPKPTYNDNLFYKPDFTSLNKGMTGSDISLTVKVPIEKAKEIESLREKGKDMLRLYGRVSGVWADSKVIRRDGAQVGLVLNVQAIEFGSRQDGQFKSYFFLDSNQLKRWQS